MVKTVELIDMSRAARGIHFRTKLLMN